MLAERTRKNYRVAAALPRDLGVVVGTNPDAIRIKATTTPRSPKGVWRRALRRLLDEQGGGLPAVDERRHLLVAWALLEAFRRVQQSRQDLHIPGGEQERLRPAEHPVRREVDIRLLPQRLVPGRRRLG